MPRLVLLDVALAVARLDGGSAAMRAGVKEVRFSKLRTGREEATAAEKAAIAKVLDWPVTELFPANPQVALKRFLERATAKDREALSEALIASAPKVSK